MPARCVLLQCAIVKHALLTFSFQSAIDFSARLLSLPIAIPSFFRLVCRLPWAVELSKLAELNDSAGGYDWAWQKEAKALEEAAENAAALGGNTGGAASEEDINITSSLKLSMDNILMVGGELFFGHLHYGLFSYNEKESVTT